MLDPPGYFKMAYFVHYPAVVQIMYPDGKQGNVVAIPAAFGIRVLVETLGMTTQEVMVVAVAKLCHK